MKPRIFKIDPLNIDLGALKTAAEVIHNRGLVAFPTETVYGLGANALDPKAVTGIFAAKKRPLDDPLIVHIADMGDIEKLARYVPKAAYKLVDRFWPGALTLVLPKTELVPDLVTTGLDTVALRMPSSPIARKFIETAGVPIAAPSANLFGRPSPTKAKHVLNDLDGRIDVILDGGTTEIGVESTVVECVEGKMVILRPGGVAAEEIEALTGRLEIISHEEDVVSSPGKYPQHYSPMAKVLVVENGLYQADEVRGHIEESRAAGRKAAILAKQEHESEFRGYPLKVLGPEADGKTCALRLFHLLREFDEEGTDVIIAEAIHEKGLGLAVMNRLRKAAGPDM